MELYLKYWQAPGRDITQYDRRSEPGDFRRRSSRADLSSSINLDKSCDCAMMLYRPGEERKGVIGRQGGREGGRAMSDLCFVLLEAFTPRSARPQHQPRRSSLHSALVCSVEPVLCNWMVHSSKASK